MQELVFLIMTDGDFEVAMKTRLEERVPMLEMAMPGQPADYDILMERPSPRIIKTHLYFKCFAKTVEKARSKFIVVSRDPKDCIVSYFHQYRDIIGYSGSFDEYFEMYKCKELIFGDPFDHAIGWWEHKDEDNFLFTTYAEMKQDIRGVIKRVTAFLSKELSAEIIERIVAHTSFEQMKGNPMVNNSEVADNFIRKGVVGDWVHYFRDDQRSLIDSKAKEVEEKYGITF